ncbi:MAG: SNF2 helicase associated domain-containing protein [Eubacteriales bacterium]|nr:SNF2 helicase associated domain-containing protein [Eubacteriales bacterium]
MKEEKLRGNPKKRQQQEESRSGQEQRNKEYELVGASWESETDLTEAEGFGKNIEKLENYRYFDGTSIRNSMKIPKNTTLEGIQLYRQGRIQLKEIVSGFDGMNRERLGQMDAVGKKENREFSIRLLFNRKEIIRFSCECPKCRTDYYSQFNIKESKCPYKAGALKLMEEFLASHNIGDATDIRGQSLIAAYDAKRANLVMADSTAQEESLRLVPRLTRKDDKLTLSFKVGENKLFVIKKLDVFCENVRTSATDVYGSNTQINHKLSNFTEKGKVWIRFINRIVREETEFQQRLESSRFYYGRGKDSIGSNLNLFGWRLDEFYECLADEVIDFEDKDSSTKKKGTLSCADRNPKVTMNISAETAMGETEFHGIHVEGSIPEMYYGTDTAYYISESHLNRVEKSFLEKLEPLADLSVDDRFSFRVGRNRMSEFYNRILPQIEDIVDVTETEPEKFRSYVMPEARFVFYLDAEEEDAVCRIYAWYGDKEVSVLDVFTREGRRKIEPFRDCAKEEEILFHAMQLFPQAYPERAELRCGGDEALIYQIMKNGTEKLMELGEVRCTRRFLGHRVVNRVRVSVGVSVSSGLLDLEIATEDVPSEELLDILKSYRTKKKYYRLKDGAFVNLEDPSLEMLAELTDSMHLKAGELKKGKMKLPMYRSLYLDKLLEENDSIYSSRDRRFREMVKGFKTIKDADFKEPDSLSGIMRKYQKDGYQWLRTLEAWQFGGILADDMGLGKTLQVIAVLLSAKEEGRKGTSLVVTPASLVFNWGEEFAKYAPALNVSLITGTQEERQKKIAASEEADVLVTSYDLLKRDIVFYEDKEFAYEIIDEAQYIKNHTTAAAKAVKAVHGRIRYALTGTPIENRLSELWSIFDYLMPGFLYSYEVFKKEIETPIVKNDDEKAMKRLQKMAGPFILRRLKEDVLKDLPEKLEEYRYVKMNGTQQKVYDAQVLHMKESIARQDTEEFNKNKLQILAELTRLRQICCDPSLCFENYKGEAAKLEACLDLVQSAMDGGHRMLVFSQFTSMLEILQREMDRLGIAYYTITGSTSKERRLRMVKEFNEGTVPVFLISLKAGGVGLNLTGADVVIHYDPWWNLAAQNQATDRAHRIGQTKKVTVYKLIAKHTIEEKIQKLQEAKKNLADQVMGGETGGLGGLSREELLELLEV